jgi:putative oxidoreductase
VNEDRTRYVDIGLLVLRLGFGLSFFWFHGWPKLSGGVERWTRTGAAVEHVGIDFGHTFFGFMAGFAEAVGGLLIAAGLFFRPAAVLIAITMVVATVRHVATGQGTPAHSFKNLWVAVGLSLIGPGRYSVDHWWATRRRPPEIQIPTD